jgi:fructose-bisphosphate aldolase, class II
MPLASTADIVTSAARDRRGVGAFNVVQLEHGQAIVSGAAQAGALVILQVSQNTVRYHGGLEPVALATLAIAQRATVPVAVHLDHAESQELVQEAVGLGLTSVMFDGSRLPYEANVAATAEVVAQCHARRAVWVEAELGEVGGKDGVHAPGARTDPEEAASFVAATKVDALAVAVGTSHAMLTQEATLDFELIGRLGARVEVPLVLHGSSGVSDPDLTRAVAAGITKVNISTRLGKAFTAAVRTCLEENPSVVDTRIYLGTAREAVAAEVRRVLEVLGQGRAAPPSSRKS